jgi:hypothetical protein
MSARRPLIYLGIFAVLALVYYFYEYKGGETRAEREKQEQKALAFSPDSAVEFTVAGSDDMGTGADTVRVVRSGDGWALASPLDAAADSGAVARLLHSASEAERNRVVEDSAADLAPFGLDRPRLSFTVVPASGAAPQTLELGNKNPGDSYIYARNLAEPHRVVLLNSWLLGDLDKSVFQLRDKRLLELKPDDVDRLVVRRKSSLPLEITRKGEDWMIESPMISRAETDSVKAVLDKLLEAEARAFVDTLPAQGALAYGLADPVLTVELREAVGGAVHGLAFGSRDSSGNYFASRLGVENRIFMAGADIFDLLAADPARLRDMGLVASRRDSITSVAYTGGGEHWRAVRDSANNWNFSEPDSVKLDRTGLDNFIWDLTDLKAGEFIENSPARETAALLAPEFGIELEGPKGVEKIRFARIDGDSMYYAAGDRFRSVARLDSSHVARLRMGVKELEDRKLLDFVTSSVDRVEIARPEGKTIKLAGGEGGWKITEPEQQAAEGWKVQNLFWQMVEIEYEKVLSPTAADSAAWGFDKPSVAVRLWQGDSLVAGVVLGGALDGDSGTRFVALRISGDPRTFAVKQSVLEEIPDSAAAFTGNH